MTDTVKYGLSKEGFKRKRLPEIINSINDRLSDKLGIAIQTGSNSIFGQITGVYAYEIADLWEMAEDVYNAMYPHTASGVSLTNATSLIAITPISAEATTIICACTGDDGTTIPAGSQIQDSNSKTYTIENTSQIIKSNTSSISISLSSIITNTMYSLVINGQRSDYTAKDTDNISNILSALVNNFDINNISFNISNDLLTINTNNPTETISVTVNNLQVKDVTTPIKFVADTTGAINPAIGDVNNINTSVTGWKSVSNVFNNVGREAETDTELRRRWSVSVYKHASNMIEAIQANVLQNVTGVKACKVYENYSDVIDSSGRLPHSIEVVVNGGDEIDIAKEIFTYKVAGIDTNGEINIDVNDSQGIAHVIKFNRPTPIIIWLKLIINKNNEEIWGNNTPKEVKTLVLKKANELNIGDNVILQKFIGEIFNNMNGIGYIDIKASIGETPKDYTNENINIADHELADFDISRIEVIIND